MDGEVIMAWYTPQLSIDNIELNVSDIALNTDQVESDLILLETLHTATNSDLVVQHGLTTITNSDLILLETLHTATNTDLDAIVAALAGTGKTYTRVAIDEAADQTAGSIIATPGAGHHLEIHEVYLRCGLAGTVLLHDEDNTAITGTMPVGTNDLIFRPFNVVPCYVLAANKAFELTNVNAPLDGWIIYVDVTD